MRHEGRLEHDGPSVECAVCGRPDASHPHPDCAIHAIKPDRLTDLIGEWFRAALTGDNILWATLRDVVIAPHRLTLSWLSHHRTKQMSPVRTLFTVVLLGSLTTLPYRLLHPLKDDLTHLLFEAFVWQAALACCLAAIPVLALLIPRSRKSTLYHHAVFTLYEVAFLGIAVWLLVAVTMLVRLIVPDAIQYGYMLIVPLTLLLVPTVLIIMIAHAAAHMRAVYGLSSGGAVLRVLATGVAIIGVAISLSLFLSAEIARFEKARLGFSIAPPTTSL